MPSEERLDRLERIAMLMARAGLRVRREQNEKINIIIDAQIKNEDRFARNEERFAQLAASQKELAESQKELTESQKQTDKRLNALIDIAGRDRNGNSR